MYPLALMLMGGAVRNKHRQDGLDAEDRASRIANEKEEREFQRSEREFMRNERKRSIADRDAVTAAAAAPAALDGEVYQPAVDDDGNTMPANPTAGTFKVGEQRFTDRGQANAAAAAADTPAAQSKRVAMALMGRGKVAEARAERTGAMQEQTAERQGKLAEFQLSKAESDWLDDKFNKSILAATTPDELAERLSVGGAKVAARVANDGKGFQLVATRPDGTEAPFGDGFKSFEAAKVTLSRLAPKEKMTLLHQQWQQEHATAQLAQQASEGAANRNQQTVLARMREAGDDRRSAAGIAAATARAGGGAALPDATFDEKTAADIAKEQVNAEASAAMAGGKPWSGVQIAQRKDEIVETLRQTHAIRAVERAVARALGTAQGDPAAYAAQYAKARTLGVPGERLAALGFMPPAGPVVAPMGQRAERAGGVPPVAAAAAPARPQPPVDPAIDAAAKAAEQAAVKAIESQRKHQAYGLRQKANDPAGYAKAEMEAQITAGAARQAQAQYERLVAQQQTTIPRMAAQP